MNQLVQSPVAVVDLLDIVDTALATVSRRVPLHVARDDLASAGKLALITAFAQVSGSEEEIRAYCFVRVRGAMLDELRKLDTASRCQRRAARLVAHAQARLAHEHGREAQLAEIAAATQLDVRAILAAQATLAADGRKDEVAWDQLADDDAPSPAVTVELSDLRSAILAALDRLPVNQALALRLYYLEDASLDQIAAQLGVSRERARQVREAGEKRLRADFVVLSLWQTLLSDT
jgi:RNA polymerase sigma factor for flagellar operon FliA